MLRLCSVTIYHEISGSPSKSIKKKTRSEPVCSQHGYAFLPNAIFKQLRSLSITASCRENAYVHLLTHSEEEMHGDRGMEKGMQSTGGEVGVEWKRRQGTMKLYKSE